MLPIKFSHNTKSNIKQSADITSNLINCNNKLLYSDSVRLLSCDAPKVVNNTQIQGVNQPTSSKPTENIKTIASKYIAPKISRTSEIKEKDQIIIENHAATVIQRFFKKAYARSAYNYMFTTGKVFQKVVENTKKYHHFKKYQENHKDKNFDSLADLQTFSSLCIQEIKDILGTFNKQEQDFINKVTSFPKMIYVHRSFSNLLKPTLLNDNNKIIIYSNKQLKQKNIKIRSESTKKKDRKKLANDDFVFCSPYFTDSYRSKTIDQITDSYILALSCHYGTNAYFFGEEKLPYCYLTLTDQLYTKVEIFNKFSFFKGIAKKIPRHIHGVEKIKGKYNDVPMFSQKDMRLAIAYHTIHFLRSLSQTNKQHIKMRESVLNIQKIEDFNWIMHAIFNPEVHIPKILSTKKATEDINYRHGLYFLNRYAPGFVSYNK